MGIEDFIGDSATVTAKSEHALEWVRRRLAESTSKPESSIDREDLDAGLNHKHNQRLKDALLGHLRSDTSEADSPAKAPNLDNLRVEIISGGSTNVCLRIWYTEVNEQKDHTPLKHYSPGVFVKVALPHARWAGPQKKCDVSRLDNEFRCLERLGSICPGTTTLPILCSFDEIENDGSRYLVTEFLPGRWEQYYEQFKRGHIDVKVAQVLGFTLAKLHVLSPSHFGGKSGILNSTALEFISKSHYGKLLQDTISDLERADFTSKRNGQLDKDALKHNEYLKSNPDLFRALSRHRENFVNPPAETATFVHLDSHVRNILVPENEAQLVYPNRGFSPEKLEGDERFDVGKEGSMRLIDMEFSNWGPSGADIGLFMSSVLFYSLCHACGEKEVDVNPIISIIPAIWNAYTDAYAHFSKKERRSDQSVHRSLYFIAHEALGWAGVWLFRFSCPRLFHLCLKCDLMYSLPKDIDDRLRKHRSSNDESNGIAIFRYHTNTLAGKSLLMGFGDSAMEEIPQAITMEHCNAIVDSLVKEITCTVVRVKRSLEESNTIYAET